MSRWKPSAVVLLAVGLAQMASDAVGCVPARAVASATLLSPAPRVFSSVHGLETYSTRFFLEWTDRGGDTRELELTSETTARLRGPYNRRNVWGAVLAYGPVLAANERTRPMLAPVAAFGLTGDGPILRELGIDPADVAGGLRIRYEPLPGTDMDGLPRTIHVPLNALDDTEERR